MKKIMPKQGQTPLYVGQLMTLTEQAMTKHLDRLKSIEENERYSRLKNWTNEEIRQIEAQGRVPFNFAIALTKTNNISAYQRMNKTSVKAQYKVNAANEPKAMIATLAIRDVADNSNYVNIENTWFDDGIYIKYGALEPYVDYSSYIPQVRIRSIDYRDVIWDANAVDYDLKDALFVAKIKKRYRSEIESIYGVEDTQNIAPNTAAAFDGREKDSYYVGGDSNTNKDEIISEYTLYYKVSRKYWCLVFEDSQNIWGSNIIIKEYRSKKEAEEHLRKLNMPYISSGLPQEGSIEYKDKMKIDKYVFTYSKILEYEETDMEDFPITLFFPLWFRGESVALMDLFKSPQVWYDRLMAQIDYSFGRNLKNVVVGNAELLAETNSPEEAEEKLQNGGLIWLNTPNLDAFKELASPGTNPQYAQLAEVMKGLLEDFGGGRNFQGLSEGANESGVSVRAKQAAGDRLTQIFMDNFRRAKKNLFTKVLWFVHKYDNAERMIKVFGNEITHEMKTALMQSGVYYPENQYDGSVLVNQEDNQLSALDGYDYDLEIIEDAFSDTAKERNLIMYQTMLKMFPDLVQLPSVRQEVLLSMGVPYAKVMQFMQEQQQMAQQAAMAEQAQAEKSSNAQMQMAEDKNKL